MPLEPQHPPGYPASIPSPDHLDTLHEVMAGCTRCDLFLSRTQVVPGSGPSESDLLFVGEAPGASEDREGRPFVGRSGALLDAMLREADLDREHVFIANVVRCRPPRNRSPKAAEIRACAGWLEEQVRLVAPRLVVTLGRFALQHFLPKGRITVLQGALQSVEYGGHELRLYPLLHPAAILRNPTLRADYAQRFRRIPELLREMDG